MTLLRKLSCLTWLYDSVGMLCGPYRDCDVDRYNGSVTERFNGYNTQGLLRHPST